MGMLGELFKSILHPDEIIAMFKVKGLVRRVHKEPLDVLGKKLNDVDFCYAVLNKVSRSFAVVIQQLPEQLQDPVCIFYLVLRGLDSVEDDMEYPLKSKLPLLRNFHEKLEEDGWKIDGVGDSPDYRILMAHFHKVIAVYKKLGKEYRDPIKDICMKMGNGMADFAEKKVQSEKDYNLYCHYVAGLVGWGLSDLFSASKLEDESLAEEKDLSNSMGLLLQKTNIIRDYLEDLDSGRTFWPDEIWSKYANTLDEFKKSPHSAKSLACLNHLVTDALQHVPACLEYMRRLKNLEVFRFCAIPQVMAIATLSAVFNNPNVFKGVVKIRKGLSCKMMLNTNDMGKVKEHFYSFARDIEDRINPKDPNSARTRALTTQVIKECGPKGDQLPKGILRIVSVVAWVILFAVVYHLFTNYKARRAGGLAVATSSMTSSDLTAVVFGFASVGYLFGFFGVQYV